MNVASPVSLRGLRTFCVAARYESFRSAGEALFVTASAVSHQIKNLETELGQDLFDRSSGALALTAAGKSLFDAIDPLIGQLDSAVAAFRLDSPVSLIRISVQPFFASEYFVPRLAEFTSQHADIQIQVGTSDETSEKHPADADLSIRLFRTPPPDLESHRLFPLRMLPVGSPEFRERLVVRRKVVVSDFPLIVHDSQPEAWTQWSAAAGVTLPESGKVTSLDSMIAVMRAAEQGIGAALVPVPVSDQWLKQGSIVPLFKARLESEFSYYLVWKTERSDDPAVRTLRQWIVENFAQAS